MDIRKSSALTLSELLVASILIGIVMIGIASFSSSIQQLQNSTNRSSVLAMRAAAIMSSISSDAYLTVGTEFDRGISIKEAGQTKIISFRHDILNTPENYDDDFWIGYKIDQNNVLTRCRTNIGNNDPATNGNCTNPSFDEYSLGTLADLPGGQDHITIVQAEGVGPFQYIQITIPLIFDIDEDEHPITNPTYTLTTRIRPPGQTSNN